jgi:hypothetical protein
MTRLLVGPIAIFLCSACFVFGTRAMIVGVTTEVTHLLKINLNLHVNFKNEMWNLTWKAIMYYGISIMMFFIALMSILSASAESLIVPGKVFAESCQRSEPDRLSACVGFIAGVLNSYLEAGQFCIPPGTDPNKVTDFVRSYVSSNPQLISYPASKLVLLALKARYPCISNGPRIVFQLRRM